jgi:hypothetical protein
MGWQELSTSSHYQTAVAIEQELQKGNIQEATAGVKELIEGSLSFRLIVDHR